MKQAELLYALAMLCTIPMQAQTEFEQIVAERHLDENVTDLSEADDVTIDEPQMAYVNLTGFSSMPSSKHITTKAWMEFYDDHGHYMHRPVTLAGQGGYTLRFPKRNFTCHFTDETWNEDNGPTFHIGEWVEQDAFHFKAFWTDFMRGIPEVAYKLFHQLRADRQPYWERGGYFKNSAARCYPDAFPCAVYLNGHFQGLYAWQLKKHRKNMNQKKLDANHIHLDGNLNDNYIFRGKIIWTQFEVRNPKNLITATGTAYDGNYPKELIGENSSNYNADTDDDATREAKQRSAAVKNAVVAMSNYWNELNKLEKAGADISEMRMQIEDRYDIEGLIDYYVFYHFTQNGDGNLKNWQWFTYDGHQWTVAPYDLDQTFGLGLYGGNVRPPFHAIPQLNTGPFYWIERYYMDDVATRYAQLRSNEVFDCDNVNALIDSWYDRVGEEWYDREKEQWPESPCYCEPVAGDGWEPIGHDEWHLADNAPNWNNQTEYQAGDIVWQQGRPWRATKTVKGVNPVVRNAFVDSLDRLYGWVSGRIEYLDAYFAYIPTQTVFPEIAQSDTRRLTGVYSLDGKRLQKPMAGQVCIFRYSDGTARKAMVR